MKMIYLFAAFFCLLAWLLPNHYQPWLSFYQDSCMFIAALLLAYSLFQKKEIEIPYHILFLIFLIFILSIQYLLSIIYFSGEFVINSLYLLGFITTFIVGFNVQKLESSKKEKIILGFLSILLFASIISVWIQLRQWLLFTGNIWTVDLPPKGRPFANMAQPNQLSTLLIMGMMSVVYLFENKKINKWVAGLAAFFLLCGIVLAQSRTAWVFYVCFLIWWLIKNKQITMYIRPLYMIGWGGVFLSLWISLPFLANFLGVSYLQSATERATTGLDRLYQWQQILFILKDSPFWGYGWGQLNIAQLSNSTDFIKHPILGYSHNLFLDLMIWNGVILGFIISCLIVFFLLKVAIRSKDKESIILLSMVGAIFTHSMLEYPFAYAYFLLPMGFLLGIICGKQDQLIKSFYLDKKIYFLYSVVLTFLLIIIIYDYKKNESEHELMRYENVQLRNININGIEPKAILLNQLSEYIWYVRQPISTDISAQQLERMRKVVYRYPDRPVLYRYIQILYLNGQDKEMNHMLKIFNAFYKGQLTEERIQFLLQQQGFSK